MPTSRTIASEEIEMGYCDWPGLGHVLAERCRKQGTAGVGLSESHDSKGPCYSSKEVQGRGFGHDVLSYLMVYPPQIFTDIVSACQPLL